MKTIAKNNILLYALFALLAVSYAANIFLTYRVADSIVDNPIKLMYVVLGVNEEVCKNCFKAEKIINIIDASHNVVYKTTFIDYGDALSRRYIDMYDIENLPAIIVSGNVENEKIRGAWKSLGGKTVDNKIIIENLLPYYDIATKKVKGSVSAVLLKDASCDECFNENSYIKMVRNFGMTVSDIKTYTTKSAKGQELIKKYTIRYVPTVLFSSDAGDYPGFLKAWNKVGSIEQDGVLVFRRVGQLGAQYREI